MADLKINYCDKEFDNPFILPSGIITEIPDHFRAVAAGAGGITFKSLTLQVRSGNPLPQICKYDHGILNSVGLKNAGIENGAAEIKKFMEENPEVPAIVSIFATTVDDFVRLAQILIPLKPAFIELNLSCPNVKNEFGHPVGEDGEAARAIIRAVKDVSGQVPVLAKLSPNVPDIARIARSCEAGGADGIVAINTVGPRMVIDIIKKRPVLGSGSGGISGPGIFPVSVRCVYDIYEAVKIPIIGMGGVTKWQDVVEIMMAGATLVGVGSAAYLKGFKVYGELKEGLGSYMKSAGVTNLRELIGAAHRV